MDKEAIAADALNSLKGVTTDSSCCGHGERPYDIFFDCRSEASLFFLGRCTDTRYWKYGHKWKIIVNIADVSSNGHLPVHYMLISEDVGEDAYKQAESLVENIEYHLNHKNFIKGFNLEGKLLKD